MQGSDILGRKEGGIVGKFRHEERANISDILRREAGGIDDIRKTWA